jgi:uncharacterized protein YyaL (SSP411 family)
VGTDASKVLRLKEDYDGAEPSGNSVAILNLLRLAQFTGRAVYRDSAERAIKAFSQRLNLAPVALPQMLTACEFQLSEPRQIVLVGEKSAPDTQSLVRTLYEGFIPNRIVVLVDSQETRQVLAQRIPAIEPMLAVEGRASAYVCRNYTCQLPVNEPSKLAELIQ